MKYFQNVIILALLCLSSTSFCCTEAKPRSFPATQEVIDFCNEQTQIQVYGSLLEIKNYGSRRDLYENPRLVSIHNVVRVIDNHDAMMSCSYYIPILSSLQYCESNNIKVCMLILHPLVIASATQSYPSNDIIIIKGYDRNDIHNLMKEVAQK